MLNMRFIRHKDLCNRLKTSSNPRIQNRITKKKWRECRKTFRRHVCCVRLKIYGIRLGIRISAPYAWMPLLHTFDFNRALRAGRVKQLVPFEENFQYRMMRFTKKARQNEIGFWKSQEKGSCETVVRIWAIKRHETEKNKGKLPICEIWK